MKRKPMSKSQSKKTFTKNAAPHPKNTKGATKLMRGGIRL